MFPVAQEGLFLVWGKSFSPETFAPFYNPSLNRFRFVENKSQVYLQAVSASCPHTWLPLGIKQGRDRARLPSEREIYYTKKMKSEGALSVYVGALSHIVVPDGSQVF